jgi:cytochrome c oxidase subunit II
VDLFGQDVKLTTGARVPVDEAYLRESILQPNAKIVAGYQPIMPSFQGLVTEEGVLQLIEYIKSLTPKPGTPPDHTGIVSGTVPKR